MSIAAPHEHCFHGSSLDAHQQMMDKEAVVHTHNGILLSYKKECIGVSSNQVDETGAYYIDCWWFSC